jgi:hypothetical protein
VESATRAISESAKTMLLHSTARGPSVMPLCLWL